jgi:hypothetical protein
MECSRDRVIAKVRKCFPHEPPEKIMAMLDLYPEYFGSERVHMAILKLSEGKIERLQHYVDIANSDYRDVLAWAEYPEEMRSDARSMKNAEEVEQIRARDRKQYLDWLNG